MCIRIMFFCACHVTFVERKKTSADVGGGWQIKKIHVSERVFVAITDSIWQVTSFGYLLQHATAYCGSGC